jgi:outer membrane protein OmpA-like peptidoglycan-associated protein
MKLSLVTCRVAFLLAPSFGLGCATQTAPDARVPSIQSAYVERAAPSSAQNEVDRPMSTRDDAERAIDRVAPFAAVRQRPGGMVLKVEDSVLFQAGTADLMPTARDRLDRIAQTLHDVGSRSIVVHGYVDRSGDRRRDALLSLSRADAVRRYLIDRGIAADVVRAEGLGPDEPATATTPNAPPVGRADNPRIEIVVERR